MPVFQNSRRVGTSMSSANAPLTMNFVSVAIIIISASHFCGLFQPLRLATNTHDQIYVAIYLSL